MTINDKPKNIQCWYDVSEGFIQVKRFDPWSCVEYKRICRMLKGGRLQVLYKFDTKDCKWDKGTAMPSYVSNCRKDFKVTDYWPTEEEMVADMFVELL